MLLFFFFFSSRRRHTRSLCDWSSDVCSSDLNYFLFLFVTFFAVLLDTFLRVGTALFIPSAAMNESKKLFAIHITTLRLAEVLNEGGFVPHFLFMKHPTRSGFGVADHPIF